MTTTATPARACKAALQQATMRWPDRSTASDGIVGDASHQATVSDHNTGDAFDLTHDPANGCDCGTISKTIIADPRAKYVIFNKLIWSRARAAEGWRVYTGDNPHSHHMHVSIYGDDAHRNDVSPWAGITRVAVPKPIARKRLTRTFYPRAKTTFGSLPVGGKLLAGHDYDIYAVSGRGGAWYKVLVRRTTTGTPVWGYVPRAYWI